MTSELFFVLPVLGGIISLLAGLIAIFWFRFTVSACSPAVQKFHPLANVDVRGVWQENGLDQELEVLLDRRLTGMVEAMKEQIPMAGMLLSQAREEKLKGQAQIELVKAVPEIKQMLLHHLEIRVKTGSDKVLFKSKCEAKSSETVKSKSPCANRLCFLLTVTLFGVLAGFAAALLI